MPRPASDLVVRVAAQGELAAAGALTVAGYEADGHLTRGDGRHDAKYAGWLADAAGRSRGSTVLVALDGDDLLGTVTWCPPGSPHRELATHDQQGEFRSLSVSPTARGRGAGRALVVACLDRARTLGLTEVLLCSMTQMVPAHRLYASMGFVRRPDLDWSPVPDVDLWAFSIGL